MPFVLEDFINDCKKAVASPSAQEEIRAILAEGVFEPSSVLAELGTPTEGGLNTLYHADDLTILNIVWAPEMTLHAHNHCMWANIGIYGGREENNFYQNTPGGLVQHSQSLLVEKQVSPLHEDVIHSVHNPLSKLTAAIHVYGGDFFGAPRSEWDPETFLEHPYDIEHTRAVFAQANQRIIEL